MAAVPEGDNIYDVQGTVLYRVVSRHDHLRETQSGFPPSATATAATASGAVGAAANSTVAKSAATSPSTLLPASLRGKQQLQQPPARLAPLPGSAFALSSNAAGIPSASSLHTAAATTTAAAPGLTGEPQTQTLGLPGAPTGGAEDTSLATLLMLDQLFPPKRLREDGSEPSDDDDGGDGEKDPDQAVDKSVVGANGVKGGGPHSSAFEVNDSYVASAAASTNPQWLKVAALDHTSRLDVVLLKQHLERRCVDEHARPRGTLCPIRERIFNDGLREITRQVTLLCPERGQLLQELCDGMDQSTGIYDVLLNSASQYAVRKSTERDLKAYLFEDRRALESEVRRCENRVHELRAKYAGMKKRFDEQKAATEKVHEAEINYVKGSNQQIVSEIKRLMSALDTNGK